MNLIIQYFRFFKSGTFKFADKFKFIHTLLLKFLTMCQIWLKYVD